MSKTITINNDHYIVKLFQASDDSSFRDEEIQLSAFAYNALTKLFQQADSGTTFEFENKGIWQEAKDHFDFIKDDRDYPELKSKKFTFKLMEQSR